MKTIRREERKVVKENESKQTNDFPQKMAHVTSVTVRGPDGFYLVSEQGEPLAGPFASEFEANDVAKYMSKTVGEGPVSMYQEVGSRIPYQESQQTEFKGTANPWGDLPTRQEQADFRGRTRGIPSGGFGNISANVKGDIKDLGGFLKTGVEGLLDVSTKAMDRAIDVGNKYISAPFEKMIENPYKDPFKRKVFDDVLEDEGYRLFPYGDVKGKLTTGIGHLGGDPRDVGTGFLGAVDRAFTTPDEAGSLAAKDIDEKIATARRVLTPSVYDNLSEDAKLAVVNMTFRGDLKKTHKFVKLIKQGRMDEAATEFLDNNDYRAGIARRRFEKNAERLRK